MRCPKCHYLSFDPDPRCKNCGYDLDVETEDESEASDLDLRMVPVASPTPSAPDLPLRNVEVTAPPRPVTLELVKPESPQLDEPEQEFEPEPEPEPALAMVAAVPAPPPIIRRPPPRPAPPTTELPLFVKTMGPREFGPFAGLATDTETHDEEPDPLPVVPVPPSARPLSVRRPVVDPPRPSARIQRRPGPLDNDLLEDLQRLEREEAIRLSKGAAASSPSRSRAGAGDGPEVELSHRAGAAALDGLLLAGIGAFVLWATLKVAGVSPSDLGMAAIAPMAVFLVGVGIAYLLMFTAAGGQTVGKMLMGIRVVGDTRSDTDRVTLGQAAARSVMAPVSVAALGLGWLPALFGRGPALHDRLAHTRVVRA